MGIADFTTRRLYDKLDLPTTYMNGLTANALAAIKVPIVLDSDEQAMGVALHSVSAGAAPRVAIVRSTLDLAELWVSEALLDEVSAHPRLQSIGSLEDLAFGADGRLAIVSEQHPAPNVPSTT
jgi:hypothetical protein